MQRQVTGDVIGWKLFALGVPLDKKHEVLLLNLYLTGVSSDISPKISCVPSVKILSFGEIQH